MTGPFDIAICQRSKVLGFEFLEKIVGFEILGKIFFCFSFGQRIGVLGFDFLAKIRS